MKVMINNWATRSGPDPSTGWTVVGPGVCPYRYQGVLANTIINNMKPRARSGASARSSARAGPRRLGFTTSAIGDQPCAVGSRLLVRNGW